MIKCILNPFLSEKREVPHLVGGDEIEAVSFFHQSLPGYKYTPLLKLEGLAPNCMEIGALGPYSHLPGHW